ncbi:hypothetical protein [Paenibacillus sp. CF384]|uniref:hypothetical protein n=1 Tax=Paenibacillus sp. CF384 TaxID=1884382 RepID=UPI0008985D6E|nr:hypothetical protein [Paenibacillus sp. CF384]SDW71178.1 hypothetical protein SAMN05518855_1004236 [Paenibacillus sp. CF384]
MTTTINTLLVDDDTEYALSLRNFATQNGIHIYHAKTLDEMKEALPKIISGISVVILDIKGMITAKDQYDDENFLSLAITYLDQEYSTKPRIILTGDTEGYKYIQKFRKNEVVFRKGNESEKDMFSLIKELHTNLPEYEIYKRYSDIFQVFDLGLLASNRKQELLDLIKKVDSIDPVEIKNSLGRIRDLQEEIFFQINKHKTAYLPDNRALNDRGEISVRKAHSFLVANSVGRGYEYPLFLSEMTIASYKVACEYGVHTSRLDSGFKPTKYTVQNSFYSLLDLINWYLVLLR